MQYLKHFCVKYHRKFTNHSLEKLYPWSLASTVPVRGLERVCPRKVCPWPRIFFESLASKVVSSTPPTGYEYTLALPAPRISQIFQSAEIPQQKLLEILIEFLDGAGVLHQNIPT